MTHHLVKATIIPSIVMLIAKNRNLSEDAALELFYTSPIAEALDDDETGLYGQSPLYAYSLFEQHCSIE
jgi:hypothetical protein